MKPALDYFQPLIVVLASDAVDQPMLAIDPARPPTLPLASQRFGFSGSAKRRAPAFFNEPVYAFEFARAAALPE